jgi:formate dehydrogenase subunit beta
MSELEGALRETARRLLEEHQVDVVIGFERGTLPLRTTPCFIRDPDQVDRLVWNAGCENNLATYLHHATGKVGVVAKACDARAVVSEIVERQVPRENVVIMGVPCQGVIDRRAIEARLDGREVLEAHVAGEQLVLRGSGFEETLDLQDVLDGGCTICQHRNPSVYDILLGERVEDTEGASSPPTVEQLRSGSPDERWAYFAEEYGRCIRCYACREACPACYCPECFVDQTQPSWFAKSDDLSDIMAFHIVRVFHTAGRCLDCGACARACPMHIDLRTLGKMVEESVRELYDHEAGMDLESTPPLSAFRLDDPQGFVK